MTTTLLSILRRLTRPTNEALVNAALNAIADARSRDLRRLLDQLADRNAWRDVAFLAQLERDCAADSTADADAAR